MASSETSVQQHRVDHAAGRPERRGPSPRRSVRAEIVEEAIKSGDRDAALKAMVRAEPELMQAAQRNIIHKNNASRKVSRLAHQIAKLAK
jgi:ribosomal protein S20